MSNPPQTPSSHNLEDVSKPENTADLHTERRRVARVRLTREQFRNKENGKIFPVVDLSDHGMALRLIENSDAAFFSVGHRIEGWINLGGDKASIQAVVKFFQGTLIGCEFLPQMQEGSWTAIRRYLSPEAIGEDLHRMPTQPGQAVEWLSGRSGTDLLIWLDSASQKIEKWSLLFNGNFVQWSRDQGPSCVTGKTSPTGELSEIRGILSWDPTYLDAESEADPGKLNIAKRIILSSKIASALKLQIQETLKA